MECSNSYNITWIERIRVRSIVGIVFCDILTAVTTAFVENPPRASIIGAKYYGFPLAWIVETITKDFHTYIVFSSFVLDIVFWSLISCLGLFIMMKLTTWRR